MEDIQYRKAPRALPLARRGGSIVCGMLESERETNGGEEWHLQCNV